MANFIFRLQSVLKLKERERDRAAEAVEQAAAAKNMLLNQIDDLQSESEQQNPVREHASVGMVNVQRLVEAQRFQLFISQQIAALEANVAAIEKELELRRNKLIKCEQSLRVLEKLRDRKLAAWNTSQLQKQQARLDEWAGYRHFESANIQSASNESANIESASIESTSRDEKPAIKNQLIENEL